MTQDPFNRFMEKFGFPFVIGLCVLVPAFLLGMAVICAPLACMALALATVPVWLVGRFVTKRWGLL